MQQAVLNLREQIKDLFGPICVAKQVSGAAAIESRIRLIQPRFGLLPRLENGCCSCENLLRKIGFSHCLHPVLCEAFLTILSVISGQRASKNTPDWLRDSDHSKWQFNVKIRCQSVVLGESVGDPGDQLEATFPWLPAPA